MASTKKPKKYKYYRGSFVIGKKANGTPDRIYVRGKTKQERDEKLSEATRLYSRGLQLGEMTVREWSERWKTVYKANATDVQREHYMAKLKHDILPVVGSMRMRDVRASHLQELLNQYKGGKKGTVEKIRHAIKQLFEDAEIEGIIDRNPASRLELPDLTEEPRRPLTKIERIAVFEVAKTHKHGTYILTMLFCGIRRGECIALRVGDVDLEKRYILVNKALNLRKNIGVIEGTKATKLRRKVKNSDEDGNRIIPIPDLLHPFLISQCEGKSPDELLFPGDNGEYPTRQATRWWWKSFARSCHLLLGASTYRHQIQIDTSPFDDKITPHYLRHTYATDIYAAGIDETAQKSFLGHASRDVTDIYRKMNDSALNRARIAINEYLATQCYLPSPERRTPESLKYCIECSNKERK